MTTSRRDEHSISCPVNDCLSPFLRFSVFSTILSSAVRPSGTPAYGKLGTVNKISVISFSAELQIALIRVFFTLVFADDFFILIGHTFMSPI